VEYILVASFDIDRGSVMEHQYPGPISGDENMLAELMLPDQAHVRSQDWTIFFLHKDTSAEEEAKEERKRIRRIKRRKREYAERGEPIPEDDSLQLEGLNIRDDDTDNLDSSDEEEEAEGPPLIYVLNLVNTKQDQTVKRLVLITSLVKLADIQQRRYCKGNGDMHQAFILAHLQGLSIASWCCSC
jgi:hypothetical protein